MTHPTIHLNGTHPKDLLEAAQKASEALREALDKLSVCCPNGRDYCLPKSDSFKDAVEWHQSRMDRIQSVLNEIYELADEIRIRGAHRLR